MVLCFYKEHSLLLCGLDFNIFCISNSFEYAFEIFLVFESVSCLGPENFRQFSDAPFLVFVCFRWVSWHLAAVFRIFECI